jgi:hypothetical protein
MLSLPCTHCESAGLELQPDGRVVCRYCGTPNLLDAVICPQCEHINSAQDDTCANCRGALRRACPDCGHSNWSGLEQCQKCGRPLDAVAPLSTRWGTDPANRLNELRGGMAQVKQQQALGSQQRLAELNAIEARRLAALEAARTKQAASQRRLMLWVAVASAVFCLLLVGAILITNLR